MDTTSATGKKRIVILVLGAEENRELLNGEIEPGTTAQDVVAHFNLTGYSLRRHDDTTFFSKEQVMWSVINDGDKLVAVPVAEVGSLSIRGLLKRCGVIKESEVAPPSSNSADEIDVSGHKLTPVKTERAAVLPTVRWGGCIPPSTTPLWKDRGWKERGTKLVGTFRTAKRGYRGEIILQDGDAGGSEPSYYVFNPPRGVLSSSHGACWRPRGSNRYWVHFNSKAPVDAGISEIESQLSAHE